MNIKYLRGDLNNLSQIEKKIEIFNPEILVHLHGKGYLIFLKYFKKIFQTL